MIYCLTKIGERAYKDSSVSGNELRIIEHLKAYHSADKGELENVGGAEAIWKLKRHGLIKELG